MPKKSEPVESAVPVTTKQRKHTPKEFRIAVKAEGESPEDAELYYFVDTWEIEGSCEAAKRKIRGSIEARKAMEAIARDAGETRTMNCAQCGPEVTLVVEERKEIVVRVQ